MFLEETTFVGWIFFLCVILWVHNQGEDSRKYLITSLKESNEQEKNLSVKEQEQTPDH